MNTACKCPTDILHGNTCYVIKVDIIQTLMCFDNWSCFSLRQKFNTYTIRENMSDIECTNTSRWRCQNFSCATNAVESTSYDDRGIWM